MSANILDFRIRQKRVLTRQAFVEMVGCGGVQKE
jgi:hypothetical protein